MAGTIIMLRGYETKEETVKVESVALPLGPDKHHQPARPKGRIPRGFWHTAQGCDAGATLGNGKSRASTPKGLWHMFGIRGRNPFGVAVGFGHAPRVARKLATLGWRPQSLWDLLTILFGLSACVGSPSWLQSGQISLSDERPLSNATLLIIRHAEKPASGSGLSPEGQARAEAYVRYFQTFRLDSQPLRLDYLVAADDSEHSQRSRLTLEPLGRAIGLKPDLRFQAKRPEELARELQSSPHGKTILVCWHHREIPDLLKALGADPARLLPDGQWPALQFGWVLELRYGHDGHLLPRKTRHIKEHLMPDD